MTIADKVILQKQGQAKTADVGVEHHKEELTEEQKKAICKSLWEPVKVQTTIVLPMAQDWYSGMPICDTSGKELFKVSVARTETFVTGYGAAETRFKYRQAILTSPDGYFGAFITNKYEGGSFVNWLHFAVYTPLPNYEGQLPVDILREYGRGYVPDALDDLLGSIYQHGKFVCVDIWKDIFSYLQCTGPDKYEETLRLSKDTIRQLNMSKCLGCCLPCLCWKKYVVKFHRPDTPAGNASALERNQKNETLVVQAGHSPLAAVCAAYATDRMFYGCAPNCPGR
jgi:hypothetical protein